MVHVHSALAFLAKRALALSMPFFALGDTARYGIKAILFCATLQFDKALEALIKTIKSLAIAIISTFGLPIALVTPVEFYRSSKTWKSEKVKGLAQNIVSLEKEKRTEKEGKKIPISKASAEPAFREIRNKCIPNEKESTPLDPILKRLLDEIQYDHEEAEHIFATNAEWFSLLLVECQTQELAFDKVDNGFFYVIESLIRLKKPALRKTLMQTVVKDYATGNPATLNLKCYLEEQAQKREQSIQQEVENLKAAKTSGNQNPLVKFQQKKAQLKKQQKTLQDNLKNSQSELNQAIAEAAPEKKRVDLTKKIEGTTKRLEGIQKELEQIENQENAYPKQTNEEIEREIRDKAEAKYPPLTSDFHYFSKLYFLFKTSDPAKETFQFHLEFIKGAKFKDAACGDKLLQFLFILHKQFDTTIQNQALTTIASYFVNEGKDKKMTMQAISNALALFNLNMFDRFKEIVSSIDEKTPKLASTSLIAQLFSEKFDLSSIPKYQGDTGIDALTKDYENTVATFRNPAALLTYLSSLSNLPEPERAEAIQALTEFAAHTLDQTIHSWRHDEERSEHLQTIFKTEGLKDKWASCQLSPVTSDPSYFIGETEDPCDLLMQTVDIARCLHIGGRPERNKGLLATLIDGKIHTLIVKEKKSERIVGRTLLKLLWNENEEKPVLVLDKTYTSNHPDQEAFRKWILDYSKRRAQELGLDLITAFAELGEKDEYGAVDSKGSPAPFEYLNYNYTINNGTYSIDRTYKVA